MGQFGQVCDQPTIDLIKLGGELPNPQPTRKEIGLVGLGKPWVVVNFG